MVLAPKSISELAEVLNAQEQPFHICDHSSSRSENILSTEHLNSVLFYEPEEMVISVESGMSIKVLDELLASKGQWIPTLVAEENSCRSIGAAIATDVYHPRAFSAGALRTSILGGSFATTSGEIFKSGSRVVKSVAGYDIHRAFCGSQGKFGIITSVTLKVQPRPEAFLRFLTSNISVVSSLSPTILVQTGDNYIVECAGNKEDIEQDKATLASSQITELATDEWASAIATIRANRPRAKANTTEQELLAGVRAVFDPKQLLL